MPGRGQAGDACADDDVPAMSADHGTPLSDRRRSPAPHTRYRAGSPAPVKTGAWLLVRRGCLTAWAARIHVTAGSGDRGLLTIFSSEYTCALVPVLPSQSSLIS